MKIIKPKVELLLQEDGLEGVYKNIEIAGRTCYKSDHLIKDGSAKVFVDRMIDLGHNAMLEHGTVYLMFKLVHGHYQEDDNFYKELIKVRDKYVLNPYSKVNIKIDGFEDIDTVYVTTNMRVLVENNWLEDLDLLCEPTEFHDKRITVRFTTQVAITREFNRHRVNSMAEQSTRYCNYSKDKFGSEISVNLPEFIKMADPDINELDYSNEDFIFLCEDVTSGTTNLWKPIAFWWFANLACEFSYMNLLRRGFKPEQARTVLPFDLNTELVHTAFVSDWEHFFELRDSKHAHPDARYLAHKLKELFIKEGFIEE